MIARTSFAAALTLAGALLVPALAEASLVTDQQQPRVDFAGLTLSIGGSSEQKLAQTVTAGLDGELAQIRLPVACHSGALIVEILALDGDVPSSIPPLARKEVEASQLPPTEPPVWRAIVLDETPTPDLVAGQRFAIVLRNETGSCGLYQAFGTDPYARGDGFYDARPNPPGWVPLAGTSDPEDLPFATVMVVNDDGFCQITGFGNTPFPDSLPVCRCLEDPGLREQRCTLLHPSLFLFRRIPWPLPPGGTFKVQWTVMPLVSVPGSLQIADRLPIGFQSSLKEPLVFPGDKIAPGQSLTLGYTATAGPYPGQFRINTRIDLPTGGALADGVLGSFVDVVK